MKDLDIGHGAKIFCRITLGPITIDITQTTVSLIAVTLILIVLAKILTKKIERRPGRLQDRKSVV